MIFSYHKQIQILTLKKVLLHKETQIWTTYFKTEPPCEKFCSAKPAWLLQQGVAKGLALGGMMDELANDKMAFFRLPITHSLLCGHLSNPTFMVPTG